MQGLTARLACRVPEALQTWMTSVLLATSAIYVGPPKPELFVRSGTGSGCSAVCVTCWVWFSFVPSSRLQRRAFSAQMNPEPSCQTQRILQRAVKIPMKYDHDCMMIIAEIHSNIDYAATTNMVFGKLLVFRYRYCFVYVFLVCPFVLACAA